VCQLYEYYNQADDNDILVPKSCESFQQVEGDGISRYLDKS